jgi:uncharacterized protein YndB with AHSA1/START domain
MIQIPAEADIHCSADRIFDLIADLQGQDRWLTSSSAFRGTTEVSSNPAALGTTYNEPGPLGVRHGVVTEFQRPTAITFTQPMTIKLRLGTIDVVMRYSLTPQGETTHVHRVVTVSIPWPLKLVSPLVVGSFRHESRRTLMALKAYADGLST